MGLYTQINSGGKKIFVGALTEFNYPRKQKDFPQLVYHDEKYPN